jgi:hypothetical protein
MAQQRLDTVGGEPEKNSRLMAAEKLLDEIMEKYMTDPLKYMDALHRAGQRVLSIKSSLEKDPKVLDAKGRLEEAKADLEEAKKAVETMEAERAKEVSHLRP